jgi:hypothetical protein
VTPIRMKGFHMNMMVVDQHGTEITRGLSPDVAVATAQAIADRLRQRVYLAWEIDPDIEDEYSGEGMEIAPRRRRR